MQSALKTRNAVVVAEPMRSAVRFPLHLAVRVETVNGVVDAETQDISSTGVLFTMPFAPPVNTRLTWTLELPADRFGSDYDVTVVCTGRVVWHGHAPIDRRVGVVIDDYRIGGRHV